MPLSNYFRRFQAIRITRTTKWFLVVVLASLPLFGWGVFSSIRDGRSSSSSRQVENTITSNSDVIEETSLIQQLAEQDHAIPDLADGAELSSGLANGTGESPTPAIPQ